MELVGFVPSVVVRDPMTQAKPLVYPLVPIDRPIGTLYHAAQMALRELDRSELSPRLSVVVRIDRVIRHRDDSLSLEPAYSYNRRALVEFVEGRRAAAGMSESIEPSERWITTSAGRRVAIDSEGRITKGGPRDWRGVHIQDVPEFASRWRELMGID